MKATKIYLLLLLFSTSSCSNEIQKYSVEVEYSDSTKDTISFTKRYGFGSMVLSENCLYRYSFTNNGTYKPTGAVVCDIRRFKVISKSIKSNH